jgi:hypothetical protein
MVKIDVEGYEFKVMRGIERSLRAWRPIIAHEFAEGLLERTGASCRDVYEFIASLGHKAYCPVLQRVGLRHQLKLRPIADLNDAKQFVDLIWLPPDGPADRLHRFIT